MIRSLWISKTGLDAQQTQMDVIANNLANVSTNGFKRSRAVFEDLLYQTLRQPGAQSSQQTQLPSGLQIGTGVRPVATERVFTQGNLQQTGNSKDVAIQGQGFFQVLRPDGTTAYTRDGSFQTDAQGQLVTSSGYFVQPAITIPANAQSITIGRDGTVSITQPGVTAAGAGGYAATGNIYQSGRIAERGGELLCGNSFQRTAQYQYSRHERRGRAQPGICGNFQCERGGRTGQHDPDAARLRDQ